VLFDVDGTLLDTTYIHAGCWVEALSQFGHDRPTERVHRAIGMGSAELFDLVLGGRPPQAADIEAAHLTLYRQHWGRLRRLPGAADLVHACAAAGRQVVLASSASGEELTALRAALDCDDVISVATSSADVDASKPHPDILDEALAQAGLNPEDAVFIGDAVWDGQAATKAGVAFIAVTCGGTTAAELRQAGAIEVWADPADLLAHIGQSRLMA
jgi:HAD superfamily hydrolase (TIGR01509 family)